MCNPASFVLTRDQVFWSKEHNRHSDIISENNLCEQGVHGVNVLAVEITPPKCDYSLPITEWVYKTDQDLLPSWADAERDELRTRDALAEWSQYHNCQQTGKHSTGGDLIQQTAGDGSTQK